MELQRKTDSMNIQKSQATLTRSRNVDARRQDTQSCHEMDPIWKEKRQAKNHLAEESDRRAGRDGSYMGRSAGQSTGQVCMATFCRDLMSQKWPSNIWKPTLR